MRPQDSRAVASASPPLNTASASRLLFMSVFLPSADRLELALAGCFKSGECFSASRALRENQAFRAMNACPSRASAAARPSRGSLASGGALHLARQVAFQRRLDGR